MSDEKKPAPEKDKAKAKNGPAVQKPVELTEDQLEKASGGAGPREVENHSFRKIVDIDH